MRRMKFTALIQREGDGYVSLCPQLDIASQGDTREDARRNLREAVEGFLEVASPAEITERLNAEDRNDDPFYIMTPFYIPWGGVAIGFKY